MIAALRASEGAQLPTLTSRDAVHDERGLVGQMLGDVADDPRFSPRQHELRALSEAVEAGNGREALWRGINLSQAFTPDTTIRLTPRRRRQVVGAIGALAAIVVFLPVLWTWMAFQSAAQAYQRWLGSRPAESVGATDASQTESFLQLWATGFPDGHGTTMLATQHWLPNVAAWSTMLILLCIFLLVGERLITRSAERAEEGEYHECSIRLASALNFAQITLDSRDVADPIHGFDIIREAVEQLLAAHQQTRESAAAMLNASLSLEDSTGRVTTELEASTKSLLASFHRGVNDLVTSLDAAMAGTASALKGSVGGATKTLERSVTKTSGTLQASVTTAVGSLNASVGQVAQAVTASSSAQQELAKAASGLAANTQTLEATLHTQITNATDAISGEGARLRAEAASMAQHSGQVGDSLSQHTSALQHQITELTQIRASLERVSGLGLVGAAAGAR